MMATNATMLPPFACGHPRTDDNLKPSVDGYVCRECAQAAHRRYRQSSGYDRKRYLPTKLDNATQRFLRTMREALHYGMDEEVGEAWDRVITEAQAEAHARGGSIGFGDGKP